MRLQNMITAAIALSSAGAYAGPLNPPAGPVAPTGRFGPRIEINQANTPGDANSLFKITQPGSYYLAGNITGEIMKHGILIESDDVSIDLMGFTLRGVSGSQDGIRAETPAVDRVRVINGTVIDWNGAGIDLGSTGSAHHIRDVFAIDNNGDGIECGNDSIIESCTASLNGSAGIQCGISGVIRSCVASRNSGVGFTLGTGSSMQDCVANINSVGVSASNNCAIANCTATSNSGHGFSSAGGSLINGSVAKFNAANGIDSLSAVVVDCIASFNGVKGIDAPASIVSRCLVRQNNQGIEVGSESIVERCTVVSSDFWGITVENDCLVHQNVVAGNLGSPSINGVGIRVLGQNNRIDGNHLAANDTAITLAGNENIIVRNTQLDNTTNLSILSGSHLIGGYFTQPVDLNMTYWSNLRD